MEIFIILFLILLNGIFAMAEVALISARKSRLETEAKQGKRAAGTALRLAENPDKFLSTVQIGITLIGILTGLYSGERIAQQFGIMLAGIKPLAPYAVTIAQIVIVILVTYLTLIFGELVPKRIGLRSAERVAIVVAKPMNLLSAVASPFVWLLTKSTAGMLKLLGIEQTKESTATEEEIKAIIRESTQEGEIQEVEQDIVERVFSLGDRDVDSIMTHRSDLIFLDIALTPDEITRTVQNNLFDIYPVVDKSLDDVLGVVYLKDLFGKTDAPGFSLQQVMRPAIYFPETISVYSALEQMKQEKVGYGLISDEFGEIQGIVTLKDVLEALIGIMPELDDEQEMICREDGTWLVDGQCSFYDFLAQFDLEELYTRYEYKTLSGLILEELGHIPRTGETLKWHDFTFEIVDMDGARIDKILVTYQPSAAE